MGTDLVSVDGWLEGARPIGFFGPNQRASLIGQLERIQPHPVSGGGGTPLADGIARAGQMLDG